MAEEEQEFFEGLVPEVDEELTDKYRLLFMSDVGAEVLADILVNFCHFGAYVPPENQAAVGQHNVGMAILSRLGTFNAGKKPVVTALLGVPIKKP